MLREVSTNLAIDAAKLLDPAIYNYLSGNNDAHGVDLALLYGTRCTESPKVGLAPFSDNVITVDSQD